MLHSGVSTVTLAVDEEQKDANETRTAYVCTTHPLIKSQIGEIFTTVCQVGMGIARKLLKFGSI